MLTFFVSKGVILSGLSQTPVVLLCTAKEVRIWHE